MYPNSPALIVTPTSKYLKIELYEFEYKNSFNIHSIKILLLLYFFDTVKYILFILVFQALSLWQCKNKLNVALNCLLSLEFTVVAKQYGCHLSTTIWLILFYFLLLLTYNSNQTLYIQFLSIKKSKIKLNNINKKTYLVNDKYCKNWMKENKTSGKHVKIIIK